MNSNYAPVVVTTLNRTKHFKNCIESLSKCTHADKTDLFIFLDYPLKESHIEGFKKTKEYLSHINGFRTVNVIENSSNIGPICNFFKSQEHVLGLYDRLIFTEDDNQFSPNFLDYLNKGLEKFRFDKNVIVISAYSPLLDIPSEFKGNFYYQRRLSAWGFGRWRESPLPFSFTHQFLKEYLKSFKNIRKLYRRSPGHLLIIIRSTLNKKDIFGDVALGVHFAENEHLRCVHPTLSKVRNYGNDGTGVNCAKATNDRYIKQEIDLSSDFEFSDEEDNQKLIDFRLKKYFKLSIRGKITLLYFLLKLQFFRFF